MAGIPSGWLRTIAHRVQARAHGVAALDRRLMVVLESGGIGRRGRRR